MKTATRDEPLPLGTKVPHYGRVMAVGWIGERYYWMDYAGVISMMPAVYVERALKKSARKRGVDGE